MESFSVSLYGKKGMLDIDENGIIKVEISGMEAVLLNADSVLSCTVFGRERITIVYEKNSNRYGMVLRILDDEPARVQQYLVADTC